MSKQNGWAMGPRTRQIKDDKGVIHVEKVTNMPHVFYVDTLGNMRTVPLANGQGQNDPDHPAGRVRMRRFESKGFFPVDQCPMHRPDMIRFVDEDLRDAPCGAGDFGRRKMCRHVAEMQKRRIAANLARIAAEEERYKTFAQRSYELQEKEHRATVEALRDIATAQPTGKRRGRDE